MATLGMFGLLKYFKTTEPRPSPSAVSSRRPQVSPSDDEHTRESGSRSDSLSKLLVTDSSSESTEDLTTALRSIM